MSNKGGASGFGRVVSRVQSISVTSVSWVWTEVLGEVWRARAFWHSFTDSASRWRRVPLAIAKHDGEGKKKLDIMENNGYNREGSDTNCGGWNWILGGFLEFLKGKKGKDDESFTEITDKMHKCRNTGKWKHSRSSSLSQ